MAPVDYAFALKALDDDPLLIVEVAEIFREDCPLRMNELVMAMKEGNTERVSAVAHSLKGMVSVFGAHRAKVLAQDMEHLGRNGRLPQARMLLPALQYELLRVLDALQGGNWRLP